MLGVAGVVPQWEAPCGWVSEDGQPSRVSHGALLEPAMLGHQRRLQEGRCARAGAAGAWVELAERCDGSQTRGSLPPLHAATTARCHHGAQRLPLSPPQTTLPPARLLSHQDMLSNASSAASGMGQPAALTHAARHHQTACHPSAMSVCPSRQQSRSVDALRSSPCPCRPGCAPGQQERAQPHSSRGSGGPRAPLAALAGWQWQHEKDGLAWARVATLPIPPGVH